MNLDEQLKAALNLEAEMVQTPIPDTQHVIKGGQDRRRRRNAMWAGGGVAAALVLVAGLFGITQLDGDSDSAPYVTVTPTGSVSPSVTPSEPLTFPGQDAPNREVDPGTYRLAVGQRLDTSSIEADLTVARQGWIGQDLPTFEARNQYGGAGAQQINFLPGKADHCGPVDASWEAARRTAATNVRTLADQFARLPNGTVLQPITDTRAFGRDALHLRMRIHDDCDPAAGTSYIVSESTRGALYIGYKEVSAQDVIVDLLFIDVDGTPVVAFYWHQQGVDPALVAEVTSARDSITFVPATE